MKLLKKFAEKVIPERYQLFFIFWYLKLLRKLDHEMFYASSLLKNKRRFVDIGSNIGIYSYYFSKTFRFTDSFEPLSEITYRLNAIESNNIKIHNLALSDHRDNLDIYIPLDNGNTIHTLASLEKKNGEHIKRNVNVRTLDSFEFLDVDLIKIDVEGHEKSVLLGAKDTIKKCRPIMIVEIEQRHVDCNINEIFNIILDLNYEGFFMVNRQIKPLSLFSYEVNQAPYLENVKDSNYINNFIFIAK